MRKKKSGDQRASENVARSPEGNGRGMMQARKTAIEREKEQTGRESVLKERRESARRKESRFPPPLSTLFFSGYSEGEGEPVRKGENGRSERASERAHEQRMAVAVAAAALPPHH